MLPKLIRQICHLIFGEYIFQFRLPDSKIIIGLKSFERELYSTFTIETTSENYTFAVELNHLRWILTNILDLVVKGVDFGGIREIQLSDKSKFRFDRRHGVVCGQYGVRGFMKKYQYIDLSKNDLMLFYGELGFLIECAG